MHIYALKYYLGLLRTRYTIAIIITSTLWTIKTCDFLFDYNSRLSWSSLYNFKTRFWQTIFYILVGLQFHQNYFFKTYLIITSYCIKWNFATHDTKQTTVQHDYRVFIPFSNSAKSTTRSPQIWQQRKVAPHLILYALFTCRKSQNSSCFAQPCYRPLLLRVDSCTVTGCLSSIEPDDHWFWLSGSNVTSCVTCNNYSLAKSATSA